MARRLLNGRAGSPGAAVGRLLWIEAVDSGAAALTSERPLDARAETDRLRAALATAAIELDDLARETAGRAGEEIGAIFEAQALFARDPGIVAPSLAAVADGASAVEAIDRVAAEQADLLAGVDDAYFRERAADLRDVGRRVVDLLTGRMRPVLHRRDGQTAILAADDLDPSLIAAIRPELVGGIALVGGTPSGHAAIVARALGIPLVLGFGASLSRELDGCAALLDGAWWSNPPRTTWRPCRWTRLAMPASRVRLMDRGPRPRREPEPVAPVTAATRLSRSRRRTRSGSTSRPTWARSPRPSGRLAPAPTGLVWCGRSSCSSAGPSPPGSPNSGPSTAGWPTRWATGR